MKERIHVYPTYGREHATGDEPCWCDPEEQDSDDGLAVIVVHRDVN